MKRKIAVVTGAGSGLGKALSLKLANGGTKVYIVGRTENKLLELADDSSDLVPVHADLSTEKGRQSVLDAIADETQIDYLVHCAAIIEPFVPITLLSRVEWNIAMSSNAEAPLFLTQKLMSKYHSSKVLFVTSEPRVHPVQGASAYCISKAALSMIYQSFKTEVTSEKASFGLVSPGLIDTPMQEKIRLADHAVLPASELLIRLHENGQLNSSERSAKFLLWLLTHLDAENFSNRCWDIYDESLLPEWDI